VNAQRDLEDNAPAADTEVVKMRPRILTALGLFLVVSAVYMAAGSGRIDTIDGQYRFEVARNLAEDGSIKIVDPFLGFAINGIGGAYSPYGISPSIISLPLVYLAYLSGPESQDRQQFFFSFTSAIVAAGAAPMLFLFYTALGVHARPAIGWTLVASFATLTFPVAATVFDQPQHGFFVLCACFLAFLSARRNSIALAAAGGAALAVLVNYQETYIVVFPTLAVAVLDSSQVSSAGARRAFERCAVFLLVGGLGCCSGLDSTTIDSAACFFPAGSSRRTILLP